MIYADGESVRRNLGNRYVLVLEPLLPYLQSLRLWLEELLNQLLEGDCGAFTLSISSLGVSASNWTRVMEMDTIWIAEGSKKKIPNQNTIGSVVL